MCLVVVIVKDVSMVARFAVAIVTRFAVAVVTMVLYSPLNNLIEYVYVINSSKFIYYPKNPGSYGVLYLAYLF
jgi:hypothetical protein